MNSGLKKKKVHFFLVEECFPKVVSLLWRLDVSFLGWFFVSSS